MGLHTIVARAQDNAGAGYIGGNPNSNVAGNEVYSAPVTLNFGNVVRWFEPPSGFSDFVPISIRSDIFPSDWTVYVENEAGVIVRSFTGFTADGVVETEWDGNDNSGVPVPAEAGYRVLFTLGTEFPANAMGASGATNGGDETTLSESVTYSEAGLPEYEVTTLVPPLPEIFFDADYEARVAKGLAPPLPPAPPKLLAQGPKGIGVRKTKLSVLDVITQSGGQSAANNLQPPGPPTWNDDLVWRELHWSSGEIILARQQFQGFILPNTLNAVYANNLATLRTDITSASDDGEGLSGRVVYSNAIFVAGDEPDYDVLLNDLKQPNVRDLYYVGHSNGDAIGYSEGSPNNGITARTLRLALRNFDTPSSTKWHGRRLLTMRKPFRFVFIDRCLSVKGDLVGAFGIVEDNDHTRLGKKRRAFLGWTTTTQNSIINTTQADWSGEFWKQWIDVANGDFNVPLQNAVAAATFSEPIPMNPLIRGYHMLTWAE